MSQSFKQWVYHETKEPVVIDSDKFEAYKKDGWSDTPATFAKIKDFGIDGNDPSQVQVLGEALDGVKDRLNSELNFDTMSKNQMEEYAKRHFNVDLDRRRTKKVLLAEIKELASV